MIVQREDDRSDHQYLAGMLSEMAYYGRTSVEWNGIVQALIEWGIENKEEEMVEKYFNAQYYYTGKALFDDWYAEVGRLTTLTSLITSIAGFLGGGGSLLRRNSGKRLSSPGGIGNRSSGRSFSSDSRNSGGRCWSKWHNHGVRGEARGEANREKSEGILRLKILKITWTRLWSDKG